MQHEDVEAIDAEVRERDLNFARDEVRRAARWVASLREKDRIDASDSQPSTDRALRGAVSVDVPQVNRSAACLMELVE
jgi:hypothetical protein